MISFGGIIGAGLFVGGSSAIAAGGPAVVIVYGAAGLLVFLIMRMLGEMAVANPGQGSFVEYSALALGRWAGFATGWLYWYSWVFTVGAETVAGSERLEAGTVWVNTYRDVSYTTPFGGYKQSGIGRENGLEGIREYLQTKAVWLSTAKEIADPFVIG
jgi:amino acid permease